MVCPTTGMKFMSPPQRGTTCWCRCAAIPAPAGYNIGMNQGAVAGAGVKAHLHQHVVPRWGGDSNFLPVIAQTKALPMLLEDVRRRLVAAWPTD